MERGRWGTSLPERVAVVKKDDVFRVVQVAFATIAVVFLVATYATPVMASSQVRVIGVPSAPEYVYVVVVKHFSAPDKELLDYLLNKPTE